MIIHLKKMRAGRSLPSLKTRISVDWKKQLFLILCTSICLSAHAMKLPASTSTKNWFNRVFLLPSLHEAIMAGDLETTQKIIESGADANKQDKKTGDTALIVAAERGHVAIVQCLLSAGAQINHQNKEGETALIKTANTEIIKCLIEAGANPYLQTTDQCTALIFASRRIDLEGSCLLIDAMVSKNRLDGLTQEENDAKVSAEIGKIKIKEFRYRLLEKYFPEPFRASEQNQLGKDLIDVIRNKRLAEVEELITAGANLNYIDYAQFPYNESALMAFAQLPPSHATPVSYAHLLIKNGAEVNLLNSDNENALFHALEQQTPSDKLIQVLLDAGIDIYQKNKREETALYKRLESFENRDPKDRNCIQRILNKAIELSPLEKQSLKNWFLLNKKLKAENRGIPDGMKGVEKIILSHLFQSIALDASERVKKVTGGYPQMIATELHLAASDPLSADVLAFDPFDLQYKKELLEFFEPYLSMNKLTKHVIKECGKELHKK